MIWQYMVLGINGLFEQEQIIHEEKLLKGSVVIYIYADTHALARRKENWQQNMIHDTTFTGYLLMNKPKSGSL